MPYMDLVFHNIQARPAIYNAPSANYFGFPGWANVMQSALGAAGAVGGPGGGAYGAAAPSQAWGFSVSGGQATGIFVCEGPPYANFHGSWIAPPFPAPPAGVNWWVAAGLTPFPPAANRLLTYFDNPAAHLPPVPPPAGAPAPAPPLPGGSFGGGRMHCLGTGALPGWNAPPAGIALPGSDRYGIRFQAEWRYPGGGPPVTGLFVHTKNTNASPGLQAAALCRHFPNDLVFGDLNLNLRHPLKLAALADAVAATHTVLAIRQPGPGPFYYTRYNAAGAGMSTLDFVLVPHLVANLVELWACRPSPAVARLERNGSDHSIMMLRICCQ